MQLSLRIKIYIASIFLGTYLAHTSDLIDRFHVSRFVFVSIINLLGLIFIVPRLKAIRLQLFDGVLFAFYALHLISISWSLNFAEAIFTAQKGLLLFISYFIFRLILEKHKEANVLIANTILALSLLVLSVTSLQVLEVGSAKGLDGKVIYELVGWAGHKNLVASYIFFLFCYLVSKASYIKYKKLLFFTLVWQVLLIVLFRSRAVYIALFSFLAIGAVYYVWQNSTHRKLIFYKLLPAFIGISIIGATIANQSETGRTYLKYFNPSTYQQSASAVEREFVWYKTKELIEDRPILGYGSGNWKIIFPSKSIAGGYRLQEKGLVFTRAHNDFLEVWTEVGSLGFLLYFGLFVGAIVLLFLQYRKTESSAQKTQLVWLSGAILGYFIISFFDFPKERIEHQVYLALLFAAIAAETKIVLQEKWPSFKLNKRQKSIGIGLVLLCWLPNAPVSWARILGDSHSPKLMAAKSQYKTDILKASCAKIPDNWYSIDPTTLPIKWYEGLAYYVEEDYATAVLHFEEAYHVNPYNFHVLNNYASALSQLDRYSEAIPLFEEALIINPSFESGIFNLSFAYTTQGEYQKALDRVKTIKKDTTKRAVFIEQIKQKMSEQQRN